MNIQPALRVRQLPAGIFAELAAAKQAALRAGKDVIDLSIGSPDLPPPPSVINSLAAAVRDPSQYGYTLLALPEFCQAVCSFYQARYGVTLQPDRHVVQVMGSQDGLAHLALALLDPGDVALIPNPGYPIYEASVRMAGGQVYPMPLRESNGFLPDLRDIPDEVARRAKLMILNHPGNPVPALATPAFFRDVVAFARYYGVAVVHDFAYSELVFDGRRAPSFLSVEGAMDVGIESNSLSKTFNMAGCRIGYFVGNPDMLAAYQALKAHIDFGLFMPLQRAAVTALTGHPADLQTQVRIYEARRDALVGALNAAGWPIAPPPATMFAWARIPAGYTSRSFAFTLLEQA
ncbi:MAG: aminotransferase class I/II-fold pyridoxal phosphate-dependent enzyme, partial [Alicyclobacillus sp.]|nr:aminotransferase class I/II-fold pyridoxal phosphate-dependent enzyme [Alicyclobacillus sp.]